MAAVGTDHSGLSITPEIRQYWRQIANWALFFAVLLFIFYGLFALFMLGTAVQGGVAAGFVTAIMAIGFYTAVVFMPAWYYYKFSSQSKQAMNTDDTGLLDEAFASLRRFYRYAGILTIVLISLYALILLVFGAAILGGAGGSGLGE